MKNIKLYRLLISTLVLTSVPVYALDLVEAYQAALINDSTYQAAIAQKGVTDAQKKQARAALLPTLSLSGSLLHTKETFLSQNRSVKTYPASMTVSLNQPLLQIDKITGYKQIDMNASSGVLQLAQAKQDLINRVIQAYFTVLLSDRNANIAAEQEKNTALQLRIVKRSFDVGNTTIIDTNEAEAAYYKAKSAAIVAKSAAENARSALGDIIGRPLDEKEMVAQLNAPLRLKMPVPDTQEKWVSRAKDEAYAVQIAKIAYKVAELEVTRKAQQRLPVISFTANQTWKSTNFKRDYDSRSEVQNFGLELSMPIFDGGLISAQVNEAEALKTKSYQSLRGIETQVAQATRTAYNQAVSGLASIEALESAQKSANASVKSNEIGRSLGMRINIDVLNAQQTSAQTQYDLAQAQFNTVLGNVNLKASISQLGDDDVRYINALLDHTKGSTPTNPNLLKKEVDDAPRLVKMEDPTDGRINKKTPQSPSKPVVNKVITVEPTIEMMPQASFNDLNKNNNLNNSSKNNDSYDVGYINALLENGAIKQARQVSWSDLPLPSTDGFTRSNIAASIGK